mgnify:CR=1 FL=1
MRFKKTTKPFSVSILIATMVTAAGIVMAGAFQGNGEAISEGNTTRHLLNKKSNTKSGRQLYQNHCLSCHQTNGSGVPGMYPSLKGNKRVTGDKALLIKVALMGEAGPVQDKGNYMGAMASYKFLSDQEISNVLTYIRTNFGNNEDPVMPQEVADVREDIE